MRIVHHGTSDHPQEMEEIDLTVGHAIEIIQPANGSFFAYDSLIAFQINASDFGQPYKGPLRVKAYAGYDTNTFLVGEGN